VTEDNVNQPKHYLIGDIEAIDAMVMVFGGKAVKMYCFPFAFKYLWRCLHKGKEVEDIKKAIWYLRFAISDDPRKDHAKRD
jgi:hypothetical protein